jgi:lysophospholipase L1-like esterase
MPQRIPMPSNRFRALALASAAALLAASGCVEDERIVTPAPAPGGDLFARYVAIGNSITAGYQSGGINDSTQAQSYAYLLAQRAGATFTMPWLARPGCEPPLVAPLSTQRLGPAGSCSLRRDVPATPLQNVAVPGALIRSTFDQRVAANILTTLILGGQSQVTRMQQARPTLVSAWIGNNDMLRAALEADLGVLTSAAAFQASLDTLVAGIRAAGPQDAVLIGVVNPRYIPASLPGAFYFAAEDQIRQAIPNFRVNANCAPYTLTGQPNVPAFRNRISIPVISALAAQAGAAGQLFVLNCADAVPYVYDAAKQTTIQERVAGFNQAIQAAATANGWGYLDPNVLLQQYFGDFGQLRVCQGLNPDSPPPFDPLFQNFGAAVATTCPGPQAPNFFGALMSFDGVHPSHAGHRLVANGLAALLNQRHGLSLPVQ